jgi:hypothetical protein
MFCALLIALFSFNNCKTTATSNSNKGFVKIFDGKTLNGWEGDSTYWRAEHGVLVGEVTPATILKRNSFIIWRGGVTNDFELRVTYRISKQGNSGINYRSEELPGLPYSLKGYQSDIDGANRYTGQNYEERGRTFLALPGQTVRLQTGQKPTVLDSAASRETLKASIKMDDWNECRLIVKGNHMQHYINGVLMSDVTDDDSANRKLTGLLGVQVHVGPPMKIEYKEFLLKKL